jgi:hypothetical protein
LLCLFAALLIPATTAFAEDGPHHHGGAPATGGTPAPPSPSPTGGAAAPSDDVQPVDDQHQCSADPPEINLNCPSETSTVPYGVHAIPTTFKVRSFTGAARKGVRHQASLDFTLDYVSTDVFSLKASGRSTKRVHKYVAVVYVYQSSNPESGRYPNVYNVRVVRLGHHKYRVTANLRETVLP